MKITRKRLIVTGIIFILLLVIIVLYLPVEKKPQNIWESPSPVALKEADILIMGDSIMGLLRNPGRIENCLHDATGAEVYNIALGGTCADMPQEGTGLTSNLHFERLSEAILQDSFADLERNADWVEENIIFYYNEVLQMIKSLDYEKINYVIIHYGANDYFSGVPIKDYKEALRKGIENMHAACPNAIIILCTPIYCNFKMEEHLEGDANTMDRGEGTMEKYVEAVKAVADEYGVYCINGFSDLEINEDSWKLYLKDGIHPNGRGMKLYAELMAEELKKIEQGAKP